MTNLERDLRWALSAQMINDRRRLALELIDRYGEELLAAAQAQVPREPTQARTCDNVDQFGQECFLHKGHIGNHRRSPATTHSKSAVMYPQEICYETVGQEAASGHPHDDSIRFCPNGRECFRQHLLDKADQAMTELTEADNASIDGANNAHGLPSGAADTDIYRTGHAAGVAAERARLLPFLDPSLLQAARAAVEASK